jgi:hypothetical protein
MDCFSKFSVPRILGDIMVGLCMECWFLVERKSRIERFIKVENGLNLLEIYK